jgi:hypothetical protein
MAAAARVGNARELQARAEFLNKLKRWEDVSLSEADPGAPLLRLILAGFQGNVSADVLKDTVTKRGGLIDSAQDPNALADALAGAQQSLQAVGMEAETVIDVLASNLGFEKEGEEGLGYSITPDLPGAKKSSVFVIREDGKYKLIGFPPDEMAIVGELVLELLGKNDLKAAQWWLDQCVRTADARPDGTGRPAVHGLWSGVTAASRGPNAIRIAAAALIGAGTGKASAIQTLQDARSKAPLALDKAQIDKALCEAFSKAKKWDELMAAGKRMQSFKNFSEEGFRYFIRGASGAGNWKEMEVEARKRFDENPSNTFAGRSVAIAKTRQGDIAGAAELARKMSEKTGADLTEHLFVAWHEMLTGKPEQKSVDKLKKAGEKAGDNPLYHSTLAMLQAKTGGVDDAQQSFKIGIKNAALGTVSPLSWAAYGELCQQYGFPDEAQSALSQIREPKSDDDGLVGWVLPLLKTKLAVR